jgi:hypothetical protein
MLRVAVAEGELVMSMSLSIKKLAAVSAAALFLVPASMAFGQGRIPPDLKGYALQEYLRTHGRPAPAPVQPAVLVPAPVYVAPPVRAMPISQPELRAPVGLDAPRPASSSPIAQPKSDGKGGQAPMCCCYPRSVN